ncbi:MAG: SDR family NAD(P)-dependent oxidoreductase, partial [Magnetospiraceae bacterium]
GAAHGLQALLPRMMQRRRGILGVVASAAGYCGLPSAAAYAPSKAALIAMAESLRPEAVAAGVDLKLINPGFIKTPLTDKNTFPMPFLMAADKAADQLVDSFLRPGFEVTFPKRLAWSMKVLRFLPYPLFFAITRRMGGF